MLDQTDLDVVGRELRVPFAVFTDRHVLALAERLLAASGDSPLAGHLLRVATAQVVQRRRGNARELEICFAFDALGADLPVLVRRVIALADDVPVQAYLDAIAGPRAGTASHGAWPLAPRPEDMGRPAAALD